LTDAFSDDDEVLVRGCGDGHCAGRPRNVESGTLQTGVVVCDAVNSVHVGDDLDAGGRVRAGLRLQDDAERGRIPRPEKIDLSCFQVHEVTLGQGFRVLEEEVNDCRGSTGLAECVNECHSVAPFVAVVGV